MGPDIGLFLAIAHFHTCDVDCRGKRNYCGEKGEMIIVLRGSGCTINGNPCLIIVRNGRVGRMCAIERDKFARP